MTLDDLAEIDLSYAPPYSSANDPVNLVAFIGQNDVSGYSPLETAAGLKAAVAAGTQAGMPPFILDVRNPGEYASGHLAGALNIPVDDLRFELSKLPKDRLIHIHCRSGFRAHLALRTLSQNGFKQLVNVTGGYMAITAEGGFETEKG